jgi:hypothetical protein
LKCHIVSSKWIEEVIGKLKEWICVLVGHHDNVGKVIEEREKAGWRLHTYQAVGNVAMATAFVNHYLLFEKGE